MSTRKLTAAGLFLLVCVFATGVARAQIFPHSYQIDCTGTACGNPPTCSSFVDVVVVGTLQMTSATAGLGSTSINIGDGHTILPPTTGQFTVTLVNGTGNAQAVGGNGIASGCFTGTEVYPKLANTTHIFGCFNDTTHDLTYTAVDKLNGASVCHGHEM